MKRLALLSIIISLSLTAGLGAQTKPLPVRLGLDTAAGGSFQFRAAKDQRFFAQHGIEAASFNFAFGIDTVNALLIDRVDTALAADYALVNSLGRGDVVVVSVLSRTTEKTKGNIVLFARTTINSPADLVGKKLGVAKGTVLEYIWAKYLEKNHIDPKAVTFVPYTTPDEAAVGVKHGDIDAVWQLGALIEKFKTYPELKLFSDLGASGTSVTGYLLFQRAFVNKNPAAVGEILLAIQQGADFVRQHKDATGDIAFRELKLPKANVVKDIDRTDYSVGFAEDDYRHLEDIKAWLEARGLLKVNYNLKDKFILAPAKQVIPSLVTFDPASLK